ncbi:hypothetical protein LZ554_002229 [Drepanopeziza brunnea f. sp. 'monogermtubi']|nr:hypothetical protein LZ554_002229 [Drepanopeziza brunnea f. sp. 'monogermtubi']
MSRDPAWKSCEPDLECPPEIEDIAESIDDVRGGPSAMSPRGAELDAMAVRTPGGGPPEGLEIMTGSETLLEEPFVLCEA